MKIIQLNKGFETMVDDDDYYSLSKFTWYVVEKSNGFYVGRTLWLGRINGKTIRLGRFSDEIEAAKSYDKAAIIYHKEYANLNFK